MLIAFLQKQSLIEYPGKISAVIFLARCNLRCVFCYVPHLVLPQKINKIKPISQKEIFSFLKERRNFLEAVAITGGEPTLNKELPDFLKKIKKLGYFVELETNGTNSQMLEILISKRLIDYVAMDIKHALEYKKYREITGGVLTKKAFKEILSSIQLLLKEKIEYEFRTTLLKEFHQKEDILDICQKIKGARRYLLQNFSKNETISKRTFTPFPQEEIEEIIREGKEFVNIQFRQYL